MSLGWNDILPSSNETSLGGITNSFDVNDTSRRRNYWRAEAIYIIRLKGYIAKRKLLFAWGLTMDQRLVTAVGTIALRYIADLSFQLKYCTNIADISELSQ